MGRIERNNEVEIEEAVEDDEVNLTDQISNDAPPMLHHDGVAQSQLSSNTSYQVFEVKCNPSLSFKYKIPKSNEIT